MNIEIRKETPQDYYETEAMTRRSFYNVYGPGCDEHLLVHKLRTHKDYLPECSRIALVDDAPLVHDDDAVGVVGGKGLLPGHGNLGAPGQEHDVVNLIVDAASDSVVLVLGGHDAAGGGEFLHVVYAVPQAGELEEGAVLSRKNLVPRRRKSLHPAHEVGVGFLGIQRRSGVLLGHLIAQALRSDTPQGDTAPQGSSSSQTKQSFHNFIS